MYKIDTEIFHVSSAAFLSLGAKNTASTTVLDASTWSKEFVLFRTIVMQWLIESDSDAMIHMQWSRCNYPLGYTVYDTSFQQPTNDLDIQTLSEGGCFINSCEVWNNQKHISIEQSCNLVIHYRLQHETSQLAVIDGWRMKATCRLTFLSLPLHVINLPDEFLPPIAPQDEINVAEHWAV